MEGGEKGGEKGKKKGKKLRKGKKTEDALQPGERSDSADKLMADIKIENK